MLNPTCPYYGRHAVVDFKMLVSQGGNQCGLIFESYSPCRMEIRGEQPDFAACEFNGTGRALELARYRQVLVVPPRAEPQ